MQNDRQIIDRFMDDMELFLSQLPPTTAEITHTFVNGIYIRKMSLPADTMITSKVHKFEHAFIVSQGRVLVYDGVHEAVILKASYTGVTLPGTRRMMIALEDTVWSNIYPTKIKPVDDTVEAVERAIEKIEQKVIEPYKNLLLN